MAGTLPKTKRLLTKNFEILGEFANLYDIAIFLGIEITNEGKVVFMGEEQTFTYDVEQWGQFSAIVDFANNHMKKFLPKEYKIYRYLVEIE